MHRLKHECLIVLDDFHLLTAPTLAEGITRLVDTLPSRARLAILTRVVPGLPLPRWRAQSRLAEISADELRFTISELRALLVDIHALPLSDASLHVIAARTEGWPAGVVLALHTALTQGPASAAQSLSTLSGSTRDIYDYLAEEAFARQPVETQRFMLATGLVSRFNLPLADSLLDTSTGENRAILDHLERSHLFIVPLDRERRWYRYHHLFEEFLSRIAVDRDPAWVRDIHRRTATWWDEQGDVSEVLQHLVAAGDFERAALLLGRHGLEMVARGHFETVRRWLSAIPEDAWPAAPRLYLIQGLTEVVSGEARQAVRSLDEARRRLRAIGDVEGEISALRWLVNSAGWEGGIALLMPLLPEIAEVETRLPDFPPASKAHILAATGRIAHWRGDLEVAERRLREAVATARASGDDYTYLWCARPLADLLSSTARFREAVALYEDILALARRRDWWHEAAHFHTELARVLMLIGHDDSAERHLGDTRLLQATIPCRVLQSDLTLENARAAARSGARDRAEALLRELIGPGEAASPYGLWRFDATVELGLLLARTDRDEAQRLLTPVVGTNGQFGVLRSAQALLVAGIAGASAELCGQAAETFATQGAPHWRTLALLNASALAPSEVRPRVAENALQAMHSLTAEGWDFILANAPAALLASFSADAMVRSRIARLMPPPSSQETRIVIRCLGPFEVVRGGHLVGPDAWPRAAPRKLLQYLVLQDRPVHREEITETLWPGVEPRHSANQLRVALSYLRRILEPDRRAREPSSLLLTSGPTIRMAQERLDLDLDRFRRALARASAAEGPASRAALSEAVEIYRGPLFADDPFEEWVQAHRDRLARQYLEVLRLLAEHEETHGRHQAALPHWLAAIEIDPAAEQAYRGLIRCYLALGRAPDALRAFESCHKAMADLGAVPSPETIALRRLIPSPTQETPR
jgi:ATP/maltotriose-dependent transcriptional regulator MalT/DNA-binding SARP family transcriptional activator